MRKEQWKPVHGQPDYQVSTNGRICKGDTIIATYPDKSGNMLFYAWNKQERLSENMRLSRAVGRAFCPDYKNNLRASYKDGDKSNCAASNLQWVPVSEVSVPPRGEKQGRSKLTWKQVEEIRQSLGGKKQLALTYGVSHSTIKDILGGKTWKPEWQPKSAPRVGQI